MRYKHDGGYQVVLLAGGQAHGLYPILPHIPRPLLPIANRPLISYQLELLQKEGFTRCIVVTDAETESPLSSFLFEEERRDTIEVDLVILESFLGTAEVLYALREKLKGNVIVLPCDLVVDPGFLHNLLLAHRSKSSACTLLLRKRVETEAEKTARRHRQKKLHAVEDQLPIIGLNKQKNTLLYFQPDDTVEQRGQNMDMEDVLNVSQTEEQGVKDISFSKSMLKIHPNVTLHRNFVDAHFYVFSSWVLEHLLDHYRTHIHSIKLDLIPFLVRCQYYPTLEGMPPAEEMNPFAEAEAYNAAPNSFASPVHCSVFILPSGYMGRARSIREYMAANEAVVQGSTRFEPYEPMVKVRAGNQYVHPSAEVSKRTQIGAGCLVGESSKVGDRCAVKKSVIGAHVAVGDRVKIMNSVVMDHVIIEEGCLIQNSVICSNVSLQQGMDIRNSVIGSFLHLDNSHGPIEGQLRQGRLQVSPRNTNG